MWTFLRLGFGSDRGSAVFLQAANSGVGAACSLPSLRRPAGWGVWAIADSATRGVNITFDTVA